MCFIPKSIWQWWKIKKYYLDFPSAVFPEISDVSYRFLSAWGYYSKHYNSYVREVTDA